MVTTFLSRTLFANAAALLLSAAALLWSTSLSLAAGPNLMINGGLEGGSQQFDLTAGFSIVDDPKEAHSGSWVLRADLSQMGGSAAQSVACWKGANYTSVVWYKGAGSLTFEIVGGDQKTVLGSAVLTGSKSWKSAAISWNSATYTNARIMLVDGIGPGSMYFDDLSTGVADGTSIAFNALKPELSKPRFQLVFDDEFDNSSTIDLKNSGAGGFNWYLQSFYSPQYNNNSNMFSVSGGALTLKDAGNNWSEVLETAHPSENSKGYIGTVFSAGHGLYAEARIAVLNIPSIGKNGWPSWWSNDMKGATGRNKAMPGNPGHVESIENDFMEYNPTWGSSGNWYSTMHDWGDPGVNIGNANSTITAPAGTDYTRYHTYGMLWVPADVANGWNGYRQAYFDGVPQQAVCWIGNQTYSGPFPPTSDTMGSYLYSLTDNDQFMLILGSSQGGIPTMNVDYVRVYAVDKSSMTIVAPQ